MTNTAETPAPLTKDTVFTFKRYEKKFLLPEDKYAAFMETAAEHLVPDAYHRSFVRSIYYDSDDFRLIRSSLERPVYKEKLRVRSYGIAKPDGSVFVELKKKYKGIVYKRRIETTPEAAENWLAGKAAAPKDTQITREIDWFLKMNPVRPMALIACDRTSWMDKDNNELRITFDENLRWRNEDMHLTSPDGGKALLPEGHRLMEIKIPGAAPLWLAHLLSREEIFPTSYSKYGTCYRDELFRPELFRAGENNTME